jgi:hypothetical protein
LFQGTGQFFELRALTTEALCPLLIAPNVGVFEFALYFLQSFALVFVVKDTPSAHRCALSDPGFCCVSGQFPLLRPLKNKRDILGKISAARKLEDKASQFVPMYSTTNWGERRPRNSLTSRR